jgi:hypothetical protein
MTLITGKQHEKRPQDSWQCQSVLSRLVLSKKGCGDNLPSDNLPTGC